MGNIIQLSGLFKSYGTVQVLRGIDLEIDHKEVVSIVGASGAGKTTLLKIIGTIEKPDQGSILLNNTDISRLNDYQLSAFRNKQIGFVFQFHHLLPEFTAVENVAIPALIAKQSKREALNKAAALLEQLGLGHRNDHKPNELSGGEQQRVAVARALMNDPAVILADEPSGNLDTDNARDLHQLFLDLRKDTGKTIVIVTHNQELAKISDRVIEMKDGMVI